jgi:Beta-lactamase enzyme family
VVSAVTAPVGCAGGDARDRERPPEAVLSGDTTATEHRAPSGEALLDLTNRLATAASAGKVGVAGGALAGGPIQSHGQLRSMRAWSTMKVPVIVAAIDARRDGKLPGGRELTPTERAAIEAAITRSDNDAALLLWNELVEAFGGEAAAAQRTEAVLRQAGDDATTVIAVPDPRGYSPFGRTIWRLDRAATFYRSLARVQLLSPADTKLVLDAMSRVVNDQRWGVGAANWDEAPPLRFKGGWGPSDSAAGGYEVLQVGLVGDGEDAVVLAIAGRAPDYATATAAASRAARAFAAGG